MQFRFIILNVSCTSLIGQLTKKVAELSRVHHFDNIYYILDSERPFRFRQTFMKIKFSCPFKNIEMIGDYGLSV